MPPPAVVGHGPTCKLCLRVWCVYEFALTVHNVCSRGLVVVLDGLSGERRGRRGGGTGAGGESDARGVAFARADADTHANHCAVYASGFRVVIGGNHKPAGSSAFQNIADVHVARVNGDGSLGAWQVAGKTRSPVSLCTAASDGNDIVLVDGIYDDGPLGGKTRRATLSSDGVLGAWQELGAMPTNVRALSSTADVRDGSLRAAYARLQDSGDGIAVLRHRCRPPCSVIGKIRNGCLELAAARNTRFRIRPRARSADIRAATRRMPSCRARKRPSFPRRWARSA